ncbi:WD40 repeat protein [Oceanihabitans sediminis]|uniref:Exo-alpha-sialidase n=1 Tax=Oceanihabitans sediminis TaxID=1812012 RepID=A0A368P200_9FLAO|nr:PD40 domain-containing protein [Oceanihabitans sediminis]MDX1774782.1 PD40 domain-containing protein [Oceanihabitans sediminis]RBP27688.1 WD40 repeat protein [Oceanihabitans sediminis]RCU56423.1 hypothetical protein DU428_12625 [Oceanihabitans sediminis]
MKKIRLVISLILISNLLSAQNESDITQFDKALNQFINVRDFCISKDGNEAFFTVQSPNQEISQLAYIKKNKNGWSKPELLPFCDSYMYLEPFLSFDNNRLFFASNRPLNDSINKKKDFDIWYVERRHKDEAWSKPKNLGKPINSELDEFYPSVSKNGNLYFTMVSPDGFGKDDIYYCEWKDDKYSNPILLGENINSAGYEFNAFISEKEDFIIYSKYKEKDGQGSGDLYISKKDTKGNWQKAVNLGTPVNTKYMEYCPFYDEQNQILYFTSKRNNIHPRNFNTISEFNKYINESNNGLSKIYKTSLKIE